MEATDDDDLSLISEEEVPSAPGPAGFVTGLVLGVLAGTVLAMIAAPQSGEETRDLLRSKAREVADRTRESAGDIQNAVTGTTTDLVDRGRAIVEQARARVDASVAEGKDAAEQHRTALDKHI